MPAYGEKDEPDFYFFSASSSCKRPSRATTEGKTGAHWRRQRVSYIRQPPARSFGCGSYPSSLQSETVVKMNGFEFTFDNQLRRRTRQVRIEFDPYDCCTICRRVPPIQTKSPPLPDLLAAFAPPSYAPTNRRVAGNVNGRRKEDVWGADKSLAEICRLP